jgi:tetratricopeptide (TPR) repeat protein
MVMTRQQCAVWQNTRSLWSQALRVDAACVFCLNGMGRALADAEKADEAEARYREALRLNPSHADANTNLGNLLLELGRTEEAMKYLAQAVVQEPESGIMHYNLGNGLAAMGRLDDAVREYERGIECRDWDPPARVFSNLAFALNAMGRFGAASAAAQRAVQSDPESARAHYNLGVARLRSGDIDSGVASFRSSVRCEPDEAMGYVEMARELRKADRSGVAREILLAGLVRFPDDAGLARELERLAPAIGADEQD